MSAPFGPHLIGETEKTLNALLRRFLSGTGLTEPEWVTLRLADLLEGRADSHGLAAAVADRAQLPDAALLVGELTRRGLLDGARLTNAGRALLETVQDVISCETAAIWDGLPVDDVAAATRVLQEVTRRTREILG